MFYIDCRISSENGICLKFKRWKGHQFWKKQGKFIGYYLFIDDTFVKSQNMDLIFYKMWIREKGIKMFQ